MTAVSLVAAEAQDATLASAPAAEKLAAAAAID
jgi:hypothetical protein